MLKMRTTQRLCFRSSFRISVVISFLICFALFVVLTGDVLNKFFKKMTNVGVVSIGSDEDTKLLPCVTLCPWEGGGSLMPCLSWYGKRHLPRSSWERVDTVQVGDVEDLIKLDWPHKTYREKTFFYKNSDYMKATFNLSEILITSPTPMVSNLDDLDITELRSINLGRCYMICFKRAYPLTTTAYLWIKRGKDIKVFITPRTSAMWIRMATPAIKLTSITLELSTMPKLASVELSLMEKRTKILNKPHMECRNYALAGNYEQCARDFISSQLTQRVNCSLPGIEDFIINLPECMEHNIAMRTFKVFIRYIYEDLRQDWVNNCPVPCSQTSYAYTLRQLHTNSWHNADYQSLLNYSMALMLSYETFSVEDETETYIYDVGSFLSSAGGNLGLLLGFSCFSVMLQLINLIRRALMKHYYWASGGDVPITI